MYRPVEVAIPLVHAIAQGSLNLCSRTLVAPRATVNGAEANNDFW